MADMINTISKHLIDFSTITSFKLERDYYHIPFVSFAAKNYNLVFGLCIGYLAFVFIGRTLMANKVRFDLRYPLAGWNAFLCIFSLCGMIRTMPYLIGLVLSVPFQDTVCTHPNQTWGVGPTGFWVMLFIYSKVPELIDTAFIVLRQRPLIFLHWYHHVTVLLFCWNSFASESGAGLYFVAMNYTVHAIMYGYYCLQALRICPKSFPVVLITAGQITQMIVGTGVCIACWYYKLSGRACQNDRTNLSAGSLMYGSYLYLFADFAVRRYIFTKPKNVKEL